VSTPANIVTAFSNTSEVLGKDADKAKGVLKEFKEFITRGNVVDLAIGVIIGGAFGAIVTSLVNNIIMPLIGAATGGHDFSGLVWKVGSAEVGYGAFIQAVVNFLIIAACIFAFVKVANRITRKPDEPEPEPEPDFAAQQVELLTEIRDALKK
jgi:large conductance mechanosensitive channel